MAATDQTYRKQKTLDVVFAVSSILMLLSIFWMLYDDYNREFKHVQRKFRDVEDEIFLRAMLDKMPDSEHIEAITKAHEMLASAKKDMQKVQRDNASAIRAAKGEREIAENDALGIKAKLDSINSLINISQDDMDRTTDKNLRESIFKHIASLIVERDKKKEEFTEANQRIVEKTKNVKEKEAKVTSAEAEHARTIADFMLTNPANGKKLMDYSLGQVSTLGDVEDALKKYTSEFDRLAKTAAAKRWKKGDWFRNLPLIDAFAAPTRIQQYTFNDLTIDYSFKQVTRYDRCTSCHLGVDRAAFDKDALAQLKNAPDELKTRLVAAHKLLRTREDLGESLGYDPSDIPGMIDAIGLNPGQINQYAAHPDLSLYVDANSPHPAEKFGCTICHGGQGSATDFHHAAHTPNSAHQKEDWEKRHEWELGEFWDYPMLAKRFTESSCLKCHHQVTDLIRYGSKEDAPKLLRGFNLIRDNGCFGCHEISGQKSGRPVGPDLRLEPNVLPLEALTAAERAAARSDPLNPPGTMRKAGPSLYHLSEKTNEKWVREWIHSPRGFRPDTKMPHFFGLSTNSHEYLAQEAPEQKDFPNAEVHAIAYYLMTESKRYLDGNDTMRADNLKRYKEFEGDPEKWKLVKIRVEQLRKKRDDGELSKEETEELREKQKYQGRKNREAELRQELATEGLSPEKKAKRQDELRDVAMTEKDKKELAEIETRLKTAGRYALLPEVLDGRMTPEEAAGQQDLINVKPVKLAEEITDGDGNNVTAKYQEYVKARGDDKKLKHGDRLFREKGCLACHVHDAVKRSGTDENDTPLPAIRDAVADFGPSLTRIAAKLGSSSQDKAGAHRWLVQWILNPKVLHPRTRMPVTHLNVEEASDLADWLLAQDAGWTPPELAAPELQTLKDLLAVNMARLLPKNELAALKENGFSEQQISDMKWDAEERILGTLSEDNLKWYLGKRAINRLGCFGCHSIPGFESAKPIGTPLNDWGKKDAERLAFENIEAYVNDHLVSESNPDGTLVKVAEIDPAKGPEIKVGAEAYEKFFLDALFNHRREGFLHQKLMEPRSFDYHRPLAYDDRLRMPQFRFARGAAAKPIGEETERQAEARSEAHAREAVMTFVLGLVADPIPFQYLNRPNGDKLAEAKGRAVIDSFNCAGCHQIRAGVYEFKRGDKPDDKLLENLRTQAREANYSKDHFFPDHNAWAGGPQPADRIRMHGVGSKVDDGKFSVTLSQALRFEESLPPDRSIRAGDAVLDLPAGAADLISHSEPYGGYFANLLAPYLIRRGSLTWTDDSRARHGLPPTLIREGERVQPDWLFRFLRHPGMVRPQHSKGKGNVEQGMVALRMPRFNMSDEDAQAIVNYFSAVDRMDNPAFGVNYPYLNMPHRQDNYLRDRNDAYIKTLPQMAKQIQGISIPAAEKELKNAQAEEAKAADPAQKKEAARAVADARKELEGLKKVLEEIPARMKSPDAFAIDSYHLLVEGRSGACLDCHNVGRLQAKGSSFGPPLEIVHDRLRPEWTERWLANPQRLLTYKSFMPTNYPRVQSFDQEKDQHLMPGTSMAHITALRDLMMIFPKVAEIPEIKNFKPKEPAGEKKQ
jgi:mono/diheme cytochrome c family protein